MHILSVGRPGKIRKEHQAVTTDLGPELGGKPLNLLGNQLDRAALSLVGRASGLKKNAAKASDVRIFSLREGAGLPLIAVVVPFQSATPDKAKIFVVLTARQEQFLKHLPATSESRSSIVTAAGDLFLSSDASLRGKTLPPLFRQVRRNVASGSAIGSLFVEKSAADPARLASFAAISRYGLTVVVERDASEMVGAIWKVILKSALWGLLFVLIAAAIAYLAARGVTAEIRRVARATEEIAAGQFEIEITPRTRDEIGALSRSVASMAAKIRGLLLEQMSKLRLQQELAVATTVQETFFPKKSLRVGAVTVNGIYQPAGECSGDWWGAYPLDEDRTFVCVADALGHGVPAALVTAMAYATFMGAWDDIKQGGQRTLDPGAILQRLNRILCETFNGALTMTCFAMILDAKQGTITYANAGHNFPLIIPRSADPKRLEGKSVDRMGQISAVFLRQGAAPLGFSRDSIYREKTVDVVAGDRVVLYTDGLIENNDPEGKQYSSIRLKKLISAGAQLSGDQILESIVQDSRQFYQGVPFADDITVVIVEIEKTAESARVDAA